MSDQSERSLVQIQAMVMVYDNLQKEWLFAGVSDGNSKVQIFHHPINNTFRVVARKLVDHEIVINCAVLKSTKYNRATETFHQWRDRQNVYGLSFMSPDDANTFGQSMENVLLSLNTATPAPPPPSHQLFSRLANDNNDVNDDNRSLHSRAQPAQGMNTLHKPSGPPPVRPPPQAPPSAPPMAKASILASTIPVATSSGPPMAPPSGPPMAPPSGPPMAPPSGPPMAPPSGPPMAPPSGPPTAPSICPPAAGGVPPPPPPPPPPSGAPLIAPPSDTSNTSEDSGNPMGGLAAAIAGAKLKKVNKPVENGTSPMGSSSSLGPPTAVQSSKQAPAMDMMSEMARKLQSRKAKAEGGVSCEESGTSSSLSVTASSVPTFQKSKVPPPWKASNTNHDNFQSSTLPAPTISRDSTTPSSLNPQSNVDLELLKQQIISEMRMEMNKLKEELVEIIRSELSRR